MKISSISAQLRDPNRVNVSIDGRFRFSLDIAQIVDLGVKQGQEIDETRLAELEEASQFGKLYARTLEYCLSRPHSEKEVRDYLWRKTRPTKRLVAAHGTRSATRSADSINDSAPHRRVIERPGVSQAIADQVLARLVERGYIDDERFATWWVENRNQTKGTSHRKLSNELRTKGVSSLLIETALAQSERDDGAELQKMIAKKRRRYPDDDKLIVYLQRQGFRYDDIRSALADSIDE